MPRSRHSSSSSSYSSGSSAESRSSEDERGSASPGKPPGKRNDQVLAVTDNDVPITDNSNNAAQDLNNGMSNGSPIARDLPCDNSSDILSDRTVSPIINRSNRSISPVINNSAPPFISNILSGARGASAGDFNRRSRSKQDLLEPQKSNDGGTPSLL